MFKITDTKPHFPVIILLIEDNLKVTKKLNDGFKRSVYWNKYKMIPNKKEDLLIIAPNNKTS